MRIVQANIDGFGRLQETRLDLDAEAVIVYGPNEAGKSTLFGFIRSMLYGYATRSNRIERQEPLSGGKHGGRLHLRSELHGELILERYAGVNGSKPGLRQAQGEGFAALSQQDWERKYLGGISESAYRQLFAIGLTELREVSALQDEELGRHLYHAGLNGGRRLAAVEKQLQQEMDNLFRPRGQNQTMNQLLKQLEQVENKLRGLPDSIHAYNETAEALRDVEAECRDLEEGLPALALQRDIAVRALALREAWLRLAANAVERSGLTDATRLPPDAETKWRLWSQELQRLEDERRRLDAALASARGEWLAIGGTDHSREGDEAEEADDGVSDAEASVENGTVSAEQAGTRNGAAWPLLALEAAAEKLHMSVEAMQALREERGGIAADKQTHEERLRRLLASISPEWTVQELTAFQGTIALRDRVRSFRGTLQEAERETARAKESLRSAAEQVREAENGGIEGELRGRHDAHEEKAVDADGYAFVPQTKEALQQAWATFDDACRAWELEALRAASVAQ